MTPESSTVRSIVANTALGVSLVLLELVALPALTGIDHHRWSDSVALVMGPVALFAYVSPPMMGQF